MDKEKILKIIEKQKAENTPEKKHQRMIDYLNSMKPFTEDYIPEPPITDIDTYKNVVIPNFIRCGAIPKDKLIKGKTYFGSCRNADKAIWLGDQFEYIRHKWGDSYPEKINHFEDDDHFDLFVPIREINSE
jgi:hypothetical protein